MTPASASTKARQHVLIIEPNFTGHRWRYVQWAAEAYTEAGYRCLIVTESSNEDHRLSRRIAAAGRPDLEIAFVDPPEPRRGGPLRLERISYVRYHRYFHHAYRLLREVEPLTLVVVPYVDYFLYALPFLGSPFGDVPWIGITMRATFHHRKVGVKAPNRPLVNAVKAMLFRQAVHVTGMRTLLSIDPTLPEWSARALGKRGATIGYLADPFPDAHADDPARARERLGFGAGRHLLVYGSITERKGLRELVAALEQMDDAPTLVVAGEHDADMRGLLSLRGPRLTPPPVQLDMFITNEMELDLFSACDAVWLGYKGHYGMSGVLVQAYRFGKPAIATAEGLIGWFCRSGELGPLLDDLSPNAIARALNQAFADGRGANAGADATRNDAPHERLLARNTLDQFKQTLREAMG
ncbi:MAG TPA: glycosyltransferase [Trinickia sp.]|nr:glycosyltransferase [Trinickia sp.]